jgi:hypothetical protein
LLLLQSIGSARPSSFSVDGPAGEVAILDRHGRALGLGQLDAGASLRPKRMFSWACTAPGADAEQVAGGSPRSSAGS